MKQVSKISFLWVAGAVVLAAWFSHSAQAANNAYTNTAGGSWETAANWSLGTTPTGADAASVTNGGTYTIILDNTTANTDPGGAGSWLTVSNLTVGNVTGLSTLLLNFTNTAKAFTMTNTIEIGGTAAGARGDLIVSNGILVVSNTFSVATGSGSGGNLIIAGGTVIPNGGTFRMASAATATGTIHVTGGQLIATNAITFLGNGGRGTLNLSNGKVTLGSVRISNGTGTGSGDLNVFGGTNQILTTLGVGQTANVTGNVLVAGGRLQVGGLTSVGVSGYGTLTLSNGTLVSSGINVGANAGSRGDVRILGGTATLSTPVGNNLNVGVSSSTGTVLVSGAGVVEFNRSVALGSATGRGYFTNQDGGTVRFVLSANDPTFTINAGSAFVITNAIFEFKDYSAAKLNGGITNITFLGNNTVSLNNSTNAILGSYTFQTNTAPNFTHLRLINGTTRWQSTNLTIGSGGTLLASNTIGSVRGITTNAGTISVVNSKLTWENPVTIQGQYASDPSTNTFLDNVTVTASGSMAGGAGDLFDFKKSLFINSTNHTGFDLISSAVSFSGGGLHTNAITGRDVGTNGIYGGNFEYGRLTLGTTNDRVYFASGDAAASNALYLVWLDLAGFTNQFATVSNLVTSLLFAPTNVNVYYEVSYLEPNNAYLQDQIYQLGDGLGGNGGLLLPAVPEPSALALLALAGCAMLRRRQR